MNYRVYLSSTLDDLQSERAAVRQALGDECVVQDSYTASGDVLVDSCLKDVADCDVYVLILGMRYGYVPQRELSRENLSITELEYQQARHKPRLVFIKEENIVPFGQTDAATGEHPLKRIQDFRKRAAEDQRPAFFKTVDDLKLAIVKAFNHLKESRIVPTQAGEAEHRTPAALPEFSMIRLYRPPNQLHESESWSKIGDGKFQRNYELAADPVFDIMVKYESSNTLAVYSVGIHLLQRIPGTGGTMGVPSDVEVHSQLTVRCPQNWKQTLGIIDDRVSTEFDNPKEMSKDNPRLRFTLMLDNFCDKDNASSCEVKFYLVTENGTAESRSIWLSQ